MIIIDRHIFLTKSIVRVCLSACNRFCLAIFLLLSWHTADSQKEDYIWLFGSDVADNLDISTIADTTNGSTNFDFNFDPPRVHYDPERIWDFFSTNGSICNEAGTMQLYTNGQVIYDGNHNIVEDTINYNAQWDNWNILWDGVLINDGLPTIQGAIILPMPDNDRMFYIFYSSYELEISRTTKMNYALVENIDNEYILLEKDIPILESDTLCSGNLNAVKHANGRDWWVIFTNIDHTIFNKFLLTNLGIKFVGSQKNGDYFEGEIGQLYFSNQGTQLAVISQTKFGQDGVELIICDFDRSNGEITNSIKDRLEGNSLSHGTSFSPNGRFLYATDSERVYQYDLEAEDIIDSRTLVAEYDGYIYYFPSDMDSITPLKTRFGWMAQGPDGKIYISTTSGSTRRFHRINNPNLEGEACDVDQHSIVTPTSLGRGVPNFPNFRLGPLDGSPADTLGLDNHPVAKYRYVQDRLEDLRVHFFDLSYYDPVDYVWDFGDGDTSTALEPNHLYDEKGVYEVCLTVSNIYDTNTSCKTLMLGTTSTADQKYDVDVSIYPNPASDYLTVSIHNYLAIDGVVRFYNMAGEMMKEEVLTSASTIVDIRELPSGVFVYQIYDGVQEIYNGKVVKVK